MHFYTGGSVLDRTDPDQGWIGLKKNFDDFQKFCGSGLDRIQFHRIRTGLRLKNFTVRSSLVGKTRVKIFINVDFVKSPKPVLIA